MIGNVIEDQFTVVFNWPLGAALSFIMLGIVVVAGAWILRRDGISQFAWVYAAAGLLCTAMITFAWWRQQPPR